MGAKRTAELIPLCHPLPLTKVEVRIEIDDELPGFRVASEVRTNAVTGVEMEALTAVSIACLTLFDMLKAIDRTMSHRRDRGDVQDRREVGRLAAHMISFDEAIELVRSVAQPLGTETVAARRGRRPRPCPTRHRADRFAACRRVGNGRLCRPRGGPFEPCPVLLEVVGESFAGRGWTARSRRAPARASSPARRCLRCADRVVIQENVRRERRRRDHR